MAMHSPTLSASRARASQTGIKPITCQPDKDELSNRNISNSARANARLMVAATRLTTDSALLGKAAFLRRLAFSKYRFWLR